MTEQVRTAYKSHRRGAWLAAITVLAAGALALVLPALALTGDPIAKPSDPGNITPKESPLGGNSFTCSSISDPHATNQFQINSPASGTYTATSLDGKTVKITLKVSAGNNATKDKYLSFRAVGGVVSDVAINGGSKTAHYHYGDTADTWVSADGWAGSGGSLGTVNADGSVSGLTVETDDTDADDKSGLHATRDNQSNLYKLSYTTFCYEPTVKIEGTVYRDNGNGSTSVLTTPHEVTLSDGSDTATTSTDATTGKYSFLVPSGGNYTICMTAAGGEVQTKPTEGTDCTSVAGYSFANLTSDVLGNDFWFAGGVEASCDDSTDPLESQFDSGNATVIARFSYYGDTCKVDGQQFVFTTYEDGNVRTAKLSSVQPLTGDCDLDSGIGCQIVAEKITWNLTGTSPELKTLKYDDPPYDAAGDPRLMEFCKKDPLDHTAPDDGVTLLRSTPPSFGYFPADILPSGETTCLIRTTQGPGPNPKRVDQVYSAYDGRVLNGG